MLGISSRDIRLGMTQAELKSKAGMPSLETTDDTSIVWIYKRGESTDTFVTLTRPELVVTSVWGQTLKSDGRVILSRGETEISAKAVFSTKPVVDNHNGAYVVQIGPDELATVQFANGAVRTIELGRPPIRGSNLR